ncbi:transcriptional regulator FtsR [Corynebacterium sp. A21]|uniref:transcriptional regulator FtsR n=1 Tax=Corynebacterium sp. A21 TaxID=3457318 RepID=UPI003FD52484
MSIGVVLERLREEFPDVTVSKIRFLESEGLITPKRTASGYRRFTDSDVERLRYILVTQRDNYLPLKVIREQLEAIDSGAVTALLSGGRTMPMISPENFQGPLATRLTDTDVAEQVGCEIGDITELTEANIIHPDSAGYFTADDVQVVGTALSLKDFGFDVRHLRSLRNTATRQAGMIAQVASPVAKSKGEGARQRAEELSQQMTALVVSLHASLVKTSLREELDS